MESRRITLLGRAYDLGRLTFEYKQPLSRLREEYILNEVEADLVCDLLFKRSIVAASFYSNNPKAEKLVFDPFDQMLKSTLPYIDKSTKITQDATEFIKENAQKIKEDIDAWNKFILEKSGQKKVKEAEEKKNKK